MAEVELRTEYWLWCGCGAWVGANSPEDFRMHFNHGWSSYDRRYGSVVKIVG